MNNNEIAIAILSPLAAMGLRWVAIAYLEKKCYDVDHDNISDWRDSVYPKMLARLSGRQAQHVERVILERIDEATRATPEKEQ